MTAATPTTNTAAVLFPFADDRDAVRADAADRQYQTATAPPATTNSYDYYYAN